MQKVLVVIDMQNDFVDGALGSTQAQMIVDNVRKKIESFDGPIIFTRDTHGIDYLEHQEGKMLPVPHCVKNTEGWHAWLNRSSRRASYHEPCILDR